MFILGIVDFDYIWSSRYRYILLDHFMVNKLDLKIICASWRKVPMFSSTIDLGYGRNNSNFNLAF